MSTHVIKRCCLTGAVFVIGLLAATERANAQAVYDQQNDLPTSTDGNYRLQSYYYFGQEFSPENESLDGVDVEITKALTTPSSDVTVRLYVAPYNHTNPPTPLATATVNPALTPGLGAGLPIDSRAMVSFRFANPVMLNTTQRYVFVVTQVSLTQNWGMSLTGNTYPGGVGISGSSDPSRFPNNGLPYDLRFRTVVNLACDQDRDGQATCGGLVDNCPTVANPGQEDPDGDGHGTACDNCPSVANPGQDDVDGDGTGNACETGTTDNDSDGVPNTVDNCVSVANAGQENLDGDAEGDACDPDIDGDGVINTADNCPNHANAGQDNLDGDTLGDACDGDIDGDGVGNSADNCPFVANPGQQNSDGDVLGDACDVPGSSGGDADSDGVADATDNCPSDPNPTQEDEDDDGRGDACDDEDDDDVDGDGVDNRRDNCPFDKNRSQADEDGDDIGDACDQESGGCSTGGGIGWAGLFALAPCLLSLGLARRRRRTG